MLLLAIEITFLLFALIGLPYVGYHILKVLVTDAFHLLKTFSRNYIKYIDKLK